MSQQLTISSLFSALALVCLALVARVGADRDVQISAAGPVAQVISTSSSAK
ncbi:hypothetical protein NAP1_09932 [Erythrobacter sp. NAP1]|uniref:hypothetical protein n=1 Tax=Erythrobacter sp. NAP1 TaxID=237727 RepID=UPI00006851E9|nr:hypothetical protein [Erythrobacter sp. NAP1]EAQ27905.1 hypothetical protein NAP1_09932 [Erythrobacter sp. NAP1]